MLFFGNLAALAGCGVMVAIGFIKRKDRILAAQCVQFGFMGIGNFLLGATAGVISNIFSVLRNLVFARLGGGLWLKLLFILGQLALTLWTGIGGLVDWLPVLAAVIFTWFLDTKSDVKFKLAIMAGQALWLFYDWHFRNYVGAAFDVLTILSNAAGIWMISRSGKQEA